MSMKNKHKILEILDSNEEYHRKLEQLKPLLDRNMSIKWGLKCIDDVFHIYENQYPEQTKLKDILLYIKAIRNYDDITEEQIKILKEFDKVLRYMLYESQGDAYSVVNSVYTLIEATYNAPFYAVNAICHTNYATRGEYNSFVEERKHEQLTLKFLKEIINTKKYKNL